MSLLAKLLLPITNLNAFLPFHSWFPHSCSMGFIPKYTTCTEVFVLGSAFKEAELRTVEGLRKQTLKIKVWN